MFRLYNGNAALDEVKDIEDLEKVLKVNDLLRHNMVVFTDGQKALKVLPDLVDIIPEAKLNLAIYHLRNNEVEEASEVLEDLEPTTPQEYILKAVTKATESQSLGEASEESLEEAKSYFHSVGKSPNEMDTIPGRQCMAQYFFLEKQFEDVNIFLSSIQSYMGKIFFVFIIISFIYLNTLTISFFLYICLADDDDFNWNYGLSLVAERDFETAEEVLLSVQCSAYKKEMCYVASLCRSYIMNGNPQNAWDLKSSIRINRDDSTYLLELIADDCYRTGHFVFAAKAFDALHEIDDNMYVDPLMCACVGAFHYVSVELSQEGAHTFQVEAIIGEIMNILKKHEDNKRSAEIVSIIKKWKKGQYKQ